MWDTFTLIGLPIAIVATAGFGLLAWLSFRRWVPRCDEEDRVIMVALGIVASVAAAIVVIVVSVSYYPFSPQYHRYAPVSGTVAKIGSRLAGNGATQKYVVVFTSSSQQYGVSDTRAALIKPGDHLSLRCIRVYQYGSSDAGFDCLWGSS